MVGKGAVREREDFIRINVRTDVGRVVKILPRSGTIYAFDGRTEKNHRKRYYSLVGRRSKKNTEVSPKYGVTPISTSRTCIRA